MAKRSFIAGAALLVVACSSARNEGDADSAAADSRAVGAPVGSDDDALIVPEGLTVTALAGGNGVLEVVALTLREGAHGSELYVAVKNGGDTPACSAAVSLELFDEREQSLAVGIGGLLTQHFYRLTDGSGAIAACVGPGDVSMAAVADLPSDLAVEDVEYVVYRTPYFALEVAPVAGLTVSQVKSLGTTYTGTLFNGLEVAVRNPSISIFAVNRVGRPLGVATASGSDEVSPGGSWAFQTSSLSETGVDQVAYPAGALVSATPRSTQD